MTTCGLAFWKSTYVSQFCSIPSGASNLECLTRSMYWHRETPPREHEGHLIRCEIYQLIFDLRHRFSQEHRETAECLAFYLFEKLVGSFSSSAVKQITIVYVFSVFFHNFMHLRTKIVWTFSNSHVFHLRCPVSSFLSSTVFSCKCMYVGAG